jgi:hypothetical protein
VTGDTFEVMGKWKVPWEKLYFRALGGVAYNIMKMRKVEKYGDGTTPRRGGSDR